MEIAFEKGASCFAAYSGGLDSTVLLHMLWQQHQKSDMILRAVHIHHGLNSKADAWQRHCEHICQQWNITLIVHHLDLSTSTENLEARAREQRYSYFSSLLNANDLLCTAHHQDDQAETFLLQLMRGAGPKGLSGIPKTSFLGHGILRRPLLHLSRQDLLSYAKKYQLSWIEDDSNDNLRFARNFMRKEILPVLKQRWPNVSKTIARSTKHCAESEQLLKDYAENLLSHSMGVNSSRLLIPPLKQLTFIQQKLVIRHYLSKQQFLLPNEAKLENLLHTFLYAAKDKNPMMTWGNVEIRRYRDELFISRILSEHHAHQVLPWHNLSTELTIPSLSMTLCATKKIGIGIKISPHQRCDIRFRECNPTLKKRFQTWGIPPWQRSRIPLLYVNDELAAVIGYEVEKKFQAKKNETGIQIEIKRAM